MVWQRPLSNVHIALNTPELTSRAHNNIQLLSSTMTSNLHHGSSNSEKQRDQTHIATSHKEKEDKQYCKTILHDTTLTQFTTQHNTSRQHATQQWTRNGTRNMEPHPLTRIQPCMSSDVKLCAIDSPWTNLFSRAMVAVVVSCLSWPSCWSLMLKITCLRCSRSLATCWHSSHSLVRKLISNQPQLGIPLQQWQSLNETDLVKIPQSNNLDNQTKHRQWNKATSNKQHGTPYVLKPTYRKIPNKNAFWNTKTPCVLRIMTTSGRLTHCRDQSATHVFLANPPKMIRNVSKIPTSSNISSFRCCDSSFFEGHNWWTKQKECRSKKSGVAWQEKSGAAMFQDQLSLSNIANQNTLVKHRTIFHREV